MKVPYGGGKFKVTQKFALGTHNGLDIVGLSSKNLIALCDGIVKQSRIVTDKSNLTWQWGNYVTIEAGDGTLITYAHLSERLVSAGNPVCKGDVIGIEGNTGYSFGSHCHLEVRNSANIVTATVNTPYYTGIPNFIQTIDASEKEVENLTKEETQALIEANKEKVYHYWSDLPSWAAKPMKALYDKGYFAGASPSDLDLGQTKMECLVSMANVLKDQKIITY